jgi:hypothetical protein
MARRAMNALQLALGSVGSGIQGYTQAKTLREEQEAERERLRKAEARQMAMDIAGLQAQGYEPVGNVQRKQQEAADAARSLAVAAMNSTRGAGMSLPSAASQQSLMQGYAEAKPERTLEYGGQQFALRETAGERQERLARGQEMRERQIEREKATALAQAKRAEQERQEKLAADAISGGPKSQAAVRLAMESPAAYKAIFEDQNALTPYQKLQYGLSRERFDFDKKRAEKQDKQAMERIPAPDRRSMTELEATIKELEKAEQVIKDNPDAFGLKTMLPNVVLGTMPGTKARAIAFGAMTKVRRTDFGTAQSKTEKESMVPVYISTGDAAPAALDKTSGLKEKAIMELNAKRSFYGLPEYAPAGSQTPSMSASDALSRLRSGGKK